MDNDKVESAIKRVRHGPIKGDLIIELKDKDKAIEIQKLVDELTEEDEDNLRRSRRLK